jgi:polysaccharide export outer membrane protein
MKNLFRLLTPVALAALIAAHPSAQGQKPAVPALPEANGAPAARGADVSTDYRLVAGDKLRIEVYKDTQLSQSLQVRPDGKITLPLVGDVPAAGRTSTELRDAIAGSLKEYIANPVVTVIVVETVPPVIYVMGEVNSPGPQPLAGQISVLQALSAAGGFKDFAKTKDIRIQRRTGSGLTTLRFNYKDAINGRSKPIYLQPGDTIIVP